MKEKTVKSFLPPAYQCHFNKKRSDIIRQIFWNFVLFFQLASKVWRSCTAQSVSVFWQGQIRNLNFLNSWSPINFLKISEHINYMIYKLYIMQTKTSCFSFLPFLDGWEQLVNPDRPLAKLFPQRTHWFEIPNKNLIVKLGLTSRIPIVKFDNFGSLLTHCAAQG